MKDTERRAALMAAEARGMKLFDRVEALGLIAPGRTERAVTEDIYALAEKEFGVKQHWHKRIVRAGPNTVTTYYDEPADRMIAADDTVYLDFGPVFEEWEADLGRSYALGRDPEKKRLVADLERIFSIVQTQYWARPAMTGAELYDLAKAEAEKAGWLFGNNSAGHIVGEFPHAQIPGNKDFNRIAAVNTDSMTSLDGKGRAKHWILEIHLVDKTRTFGGFYERLL
ncbi:MAG TPA: M24 family metallopeptidase [Casimicrobiaceae bacterium]|nr:M24 family metallopeptidase [Casimicrobiaceae bacterium]